VRRITAHLFHSLDGVVESPNLWQFDQFDGGCGAAMAQSLERTDAMLLGRVAYSEWADFWPAHPEEPFGQFANPLEKFVASRTLTGPLSWENSTLIEGDLLDFVRDLRAGDGGDVTVVGISVIRQLFLAGLIDALTLTTHPVIAGAGRTLWEAGDGPTRLTLLDSSITEKGNAILTYGPRASDATA
jgi:dihydrofolate reductase